MTQIMERDSDGDRRGQQCKCSQCQIIATCTRNFDFYSSVYGVDDKDLLFCADCSRRLINIRFLKK